MSLLLTNGRVYLNGSFRTADVLLDEEGGRVFECGTCPDHPDEALDLQEALVLPGLSDAHVHFREPGFEHKETIETGSLAGARGGFTAVCTMPNLNPVPSTLDGLRPQLDAIQRDGRIHVIPFGAITLAQDGRSQLSDMEALAPYVCGFSDDGRGIQDAGLMRDAMAAAHALDRPISAHCEDESLLGGRDIHEGSYSLAIHHAGIRSESEWRQAERDVKLADETGCAYHICHVSCRETISIVRDAKRSGVDVTCETGPHYLTLCDEDFFKIDPDEPNSGRFKMYPPICGRADRGALLQGLLDGTIDMIATDHAPHTWEEKHRGLLKSNNGVIGLETSFPVMYTKFVEPGILRLEDLVRLMAAGAKKRFCLPDHPLTASGTVAAPDFTVISVADPYAIDPADFLSKGRSTPFEGWAVRGRTLLTVAGGRVAYRDAALGNPRDQGALGSPESLESSGSPDSQDNPPAQTAAGEEA